MPANLNSFGGLWNYWGTFQGWMFYSCSEGASSELATILSARKNLCSESRCRRSNLNRSFFVMLQGISLRRHLKYFWSNSRWALQFVSVRDAVTISFSHYSSPLCLSPLWIRLRPARRDGPPRKNSYSRVSTRIGRKNKWTLFAACHENADRK